MRDPFGEAPSAAEIQALATKALDGIPENLRRHLGGIAILVEEFPDEETRAEMGLESPFDLLGLYHGISLNQKSVGAAPEDVDRIFVSCFGHKMGPLATADLIGLDTILLSLEVLRESFDDEKFRPSPLLEKMVLPQNELMLPLY